MQEKKKKSEDVIRVALVEQDESLRAAVERWLRQTPDCECVGLYEDVDTALPAILQKKPDVVLLNFEMPGVNSHESLRQIKQQAPSVRFLVLAGETEENIVVDFLKVGADGWLEKS